MITDDQFRAGLANHAAGEHLHALEGFAALDARDLLRLAVVAEAAGEPPLGQECIVWAVYNRVANPRWWGSTVTQVVLWPAQISSFWADLPLRIHDLTVESHSPTARLVDMVNRVSDIVEADGLDCPHAADPTEGATYWWNPSVCTPSWAGSMRITAWVGRHVFAVERE